MERFRLTSSVNDIKSTNLWKSLIAEFLGTFILVFIGFGSAYNNTNPVKLGLGFGLAGAVSIYCFAPISGGHINPAVSFGLLIARQISLVRFLLYFIFQIIGATAGFGTVLLMTKGNALDKSTLRIDIASIQNKWNITHLKIDEIITKINTPSAQVICEIIITFLLVFTVMRLCVEKCRSDTEKGLAAFIIGLSITIGVFCGMNISGGSMNPAVSLGVYMCNRSDSVWIQIVGPLFGGFLAGILQQLVFTSELSQDYIKRYLFGNQTEKPIPEKEKIQMDARTSDSAKKDQE